MPGVGDLHVRLDEEGGLVVIRVPSPARDNTRRSEGTRAADRDECREGAGRRSSRTGTPEVTGRRREPRVLLKYIREMGRSETRTRPGVEGGMGVAKCRVDSVWVSFTMKPFTGVGPTLVAQPKT